MKATTLLLTFFISNCLGQSTNGFSVENNEVIWEKIYGTSLSLESLISNIRSSGVLKNIEVVDKTVLAEFNTIEADVKGAGYSWGNTPIYVSRNHYSGFTTIDYKEGKYRVTVKKILLTQKYDDSLSKQGELTHLEELAIKKGKGELNNNFSNIPSAILNFTFAKLFDFNVKSKKDDW